MSPTTIAVLVVITIVAIIVVILGLCKAAAKGNIYCPNCGSEDYRITNLGGKTINHACNTCRHSW